MKTKLTLSIDKEIKEKAKVYAKANNQDLSDIIENYLKILTSEQRPDKSQKVKPVVKSLRGSFKLGDERDYKKELGKRLEEKYL